MNYCAWCCLCHSGPLCWPAGTDLFATQARDHRVADLPLACGDCENLPCQCEQPPDIDLAWLIDLADHDHIPVVISAGSRCAA